MAQRIEILAHSDDGRGKRIAHILDDMGVTATVHVVDVYTTEQSTPDTFVQSLKNAVTENILTPANTPPFDYALEIGFLPGVTDNVGHTAHELLALAGEDNPVYTSRLYLISGKIPKEKVELLSNTLGNKLIHSITIKTVEQYKNDNGMDAIIPRVSLSNQGTAADDIDLTGNDNALMSIGKNGIKNSDGTYRGPLGMSLQYMQAVRDYFRDVEKRAPKDIELETIAQTWSEHCKHTIFASPIDDIQGGIYKHYIKRATQDIRKNKGDKDFCVSVFSDNAGGIIFDDNWLITDKVETHNSPSALDPFGGSITGIVGVNRDCVGFGMGAKPIINRYGFCLADPRTNPEYYRDQSKMIPVLSPATIMKGVVEGVEAGGNQSGIPTPQGFVYFDDRFVGKPLVFVGTIGLIPRDINGAPGHVKQARPGDKIMMVGGRVGRDGIHGATFSSVALDEGSPATAVQIGDPITQKKMCDTIIKEIRDQGLYTAITDNGAGGLSSSVGEMAEQSGGFHVELDKVPLKYPGMSPWEIWISESQERMTLAVPDENTQKLIEHFAKRGVEATVIGTYTDTGRAHITWHDDTIMDMTMDFLHDGNPETPLITKEIQGGENEPQLPQTEPSETLLNILSRLNICSKEFIATQYDHNVQGTAVLGPLQGKGSVYADASITKPVFDSAKGVVLSQGLFPRYSDIDTYHMAACSLDMAVRAAVTAGADINHLALLDNFCWCSSDEPERLYQLKRSAEAIYELAVHYGTPFISGKDSMFNDFKGFDADANPVKISAPPTLLVSSIGVVPNINQAISLAPKQVGDMVYLLGETTDELGGGELYDMHDALGRNVPQVNMGRNLVLYKRYAKAARKHLIASGLALSYGGLGAGLAKKAIGGQIGLDIDLSSLGDLDATRLLYSESAGRILVTVAPQNVKAFEKIFKGFDACYQIGHVAYSDRLNIEDVLNVDIKTLENKYKEPLKDY